MKEHSLPPDDSELNALVDGRLDGAARAALRARLEADPEAAATIEAWSRQRTALRSLHEDVLQEPVPPSLLHAARTIDHRGAGLDRWQRWGGMAASVLLAFALGWAGHGQWQVQRPPGAAASAGGAIAFGRAALVAHAVYAPEVRHPVEVTAAQQDHLVQWLSKRLGRPLKVPDLGAHGYELVGGRLLPGHQGARAQFMYQNAAGERVTLYVGALEGANGARGETAFRFTSEAGMSTFYWVDQGFGYALAGKLARADLLALSESAYRQL